MNKSVSSQYNESNLDFASFQGFVHYQSKVCYSSCASSWLTSWTETTFVVEPHTKSKALLSKYLTGFIQLLRFSCMWKKYIL